MGNVFIYGAYGYTGKLIVEVAVAQGLKPKLGGRDAKKLADLANKYSLDHVAFDVTNEAEWDKLLPDIDLVLNCAGPFALTVEYVLPVCLRHRCHYLDITGEIDVFSYIASLNKEAIAAKVVLMPGVGFDIVPTDCLSAKLKERLPDGNALELAFQGNSGISRGTALSMARRYHEGGMIRDNGKLLKVPIAYQVKDIDFGGKTRLCMTIPWGDVYTAFYTTGIENITVFTGITKKTLNGLLSFKKLKWVARSAIVQWMMKAIIKKKVTGPSLKKRSTYITYLWGKISNASGKSVILEMETMESYQLTAYTAVEALKLVLKGGVEPGYKTPAGAFGANFIDQFEKYRLIEVNE